MSIPSNIAARISHPSKSVVRVTPNKGYGCAIFLDRTNGNVDVLISSMDGEESWRVKLVEAASTETVIVRSAGDSTEVVYDKR
jgi:hypothetical protein